MDGPSSDARGDAPSRCSTLRRTNAPPKVPPPTSDGQIALRHSAGQAQLHTRGGTECTPSPRLCRPSEARRRSTHLRSGGGEGFRCSAPKPRRGHTAPPPPLDSTLSVDSEAPFTKSFVSGRPCERRVRYRHVSDVEVTPRPDLSCSCQEVAERTRQGRASRVVARVNSRSTSAHRRRTPTPTGS